jgi:predicted transcriptional regulator
MNKIIKSSALEDISSINIRDIMSPNVLTVYEGWSIKRLAGFFIKHNISGAPVIASNDELVGVVTQSDVVRFESKTPSDEEMERLVQFYCGPYGRSLSKNDLEHIKKRANEHCTANSIMTHEVDSVDVSACASEACSILVQKNIHRLFITENNRLIGVVSAMDFLRKMVASKH